jgi:hypothetical protein
VGVPEGGTGRARRSARDRLGPWPVRGGGMTALRSLGRLGTDRGRILELRRSLRAMRSIYAGSPSRPMTAKSPGVPRLRPAVPDDAWAVAEVLVRGWRGGVGELPRGGRHADGANQRLDLRPASCRSAGGKIPMTAMSSRGWRRGWAGSNEPWRHASKAMASDGSRFNRSL